MSLICQREIKENQMIRSGKITLSGISDRRRPETDEEVVNMKEFQSRKCTEAGIQSSCRETPQ